MYCDLGRRENTSHRHWHIYQSTADTDSATTYNLVNHIIDRYVSDEEVSYGEQYQVYDVPSKLDVIPAVTGSIATLKLICALLNAIVLTAPKVAGKYP